MHTASLILIYKLDRWSYWTTNVNFFKLELKQRKAVLEEKELACEMNLSPKNVLKDQKYSYKSLRMHQELGNLRTQSSPVANSSNT